jgi:hypothetical protein
LMENHLESEHAVGRCLSLPVSHRTAFKRRDHLAQHLKTHGLETNSSHWKSWNREIRPRKVAWGCGFCGGVVSEWQERVEHVGDHFKRGVGGLEWDQSLVIRGLLKQAGVEEAWTALLREEGESGEGLRWDVSEPTAGLQLLLENSAAYDPDILALEARKLATKLVPATPTQTPLSLCCTTSTTIATARTAAPSPAPSLRFIDNFGFSPPSTPSTSFDAFHDADDILTYYGEYEDCTAAPNHYSHLPPPPLDFADQMTIRFATEDPLLSPDPPFVDLRPSVRRMRTLSDLRAAEVTSWDEIR